MTVDIYATQPHYVDHLAPVWHALPPDERGTVWLPLPLWGRAARAGLPRPRHAQPGMLTTGSGPVLLASHNDLGSRKRPNIVLEHGVGHSHAIPAGRPIAGRVALHLVPSQHVADLYTSADPLARVAVVGDPMLDRWVGHRPPLGQRPTVALAWHWQQTNIADAEGAFTHHESGLRQFAASIEALGGRVLGHAHPRLWRLAVRSYNEAGIEAEPEFAEVLRRADVLVADNTSALWEFAATGRPVVRLTAPWHTDTLGLPPGALAIGPAAADLREAVWLVQDAIDHDSHRATRRAASELVFANIGRAAEAAAWAILGL